MAPFGRSGATMVCILVDEGDYLAWAALISLRVALSRSSNSPGTWPGHHGGEVEGDDALLLRPRDVAGDDAPGQAFDDGGLADPGFADEHRVVLGATGEDLDDPRGSPRPRPMTGSSCPCAPPRPGRAVLLEAWKVLSGSWEVTRAVPRTSARAPSIALASAPAERRVSPAGRARRPGPGAGAPPRRSRPSWRRRSPSAASSTRARSGRRGLRVAEDAGHAAEGCRRAPAPQGGWVHAQGGRAAGSTNPRRLAGAGRGGGARGRRPEWWRALGLAGRRRATASWALWVKVFRSSRLRGD